MTNLHSASHCPTVPTPEHCTTSRTAPEPFIFADQLRSILKKLASGWHPDQALLRCEQGSPDLPTCRNTTSARKNREHEAQCCPKATDKIGMTSALRYCGLPPMLPSCSYQRSAKQHSLRIGAQGGCRPVQATESTPYISLKQRYSSRPFWILAFVVPTCQLPTILFMPAGKPEPRRRIKAR